MRKRSVRIISIITISLLILETVVVKILNIFVKKDSIEVNLALEGSKELESIDSKGFYERLNSNKLNVVYIGRPTCPDCAEFQPILEEKVKGNNLKVYYYNTDDAKKNNMKDFNKIKDELNIKYVPVLILYDGNKEVNRIGYEDYTKSNDLLDNIIKEYKLNSNS